MPQDGSIYMVSIEAYLSYNRPMLTKSLVADWTRADCGWMPHGMRRIRFARCWENGWSPWIRMKKEIHSDDDEQNSNAFHELIYALGSE